MGKTVARTNRNGTTDVDLLELGSRLIAKVVAGKPATFIMEAGTHYPEKTDSGNYDPQTMACISLNRRFASVGLAVSTNRKFPASQRAIKTGEASKSNDGSHFVKRSDAILVTLRGVRDVERATAKFGADAGSVPVVTPERRGVAAISA